MLILNSDVDTSNSISMVLVGTEEKNGHPNFYPEAALSPSLKSKIGRYYNKICVLDFERVSRLMMEFAL